MWLRVGLVFGWCWALPTSLALLVRATLRWLVAALARPSHPPLQPSNGPLVAGAPTGLRGLRTVRYAAAHVADAPRATAPLPALRHARVGWHVIWRRRQQERRASLDLQSVAVRSESDPRGPVCVVFISALLRAPGPLSGSVGSVAGVVLGRRGCRSRAGGCGRSGRGCRRRC